MHNYQLPANESTIQSFQTNVESTRNTAQSNMTKKKTISNSDSENVQISIKIPKRGKTIVKFINDSKIRANRRNKRKAGLLKKLDEFDILTGSSSIFISSGYNAFKTKVIKYATSGSSMELLMPKIQSIIFPPEIGSDTVDDDIVVIDALVADYKSVGCSCNLVIDNKTVPRYASDLVDSACIENGDIIMFGKEPLATSNSFSRE
jgi:hypothetical protein